MGASRTPFAERSAELKRQSERIDEQLAALDKLLGTACDTLATMKGVMSSATGNADITEQINSLESAISSYKQKASSIYGEIAANLLKASGKYTENLNIFSTSVGSVTKSIEAL